MSKTPKKRKPKLTKSQPQASRKGAPPHFACLSNDGKPTSNVAKVSHTLHYAMALRLQEFAFHQRISESAVIEFALQQFFARGNEASLGNLLRQNGARRRRTPIAAPYQTPNDGARAQRLS